ncbi:hypothetical protein ES703_122650 [subsurface metagenome]
MCILVLQRKYGGNVLREMIMNGKLQSIVELVEKVVQYVVAEK